MIKQILFILLFVLVFIGCRKQPMCNKRPIYKVFYNEQKKEYSYFLEKGQWMFFDAVVWKYGSK